MSIKALKEYTRYAKYAKYDKTKNRRETWDEQVDRVFDMHEKKLGVDALKLIESDFKFAKEMMRKRKILGSQRALQFGGDPILKKNIRIYNCCASYCDRPRFFQEALFNLLAGTGVGFSVQIKDIDKLPSIANLTDSKVTYFVEDSIEGWADALGVLVSSYFTSNQPFPEYFGKVIEFDFSKVRPAGSLLSWGGKAPGSAALQKSLKLINDVFAKVLTEGRNKLKPIDAYDVIMHASDAVIAGGVRRSACVSLFSPEDEEMAKSKTGDWFIKNPQRGRSNNSALLVRSETTKEDFAKLFKSTKEFGEPGFIWADSDRALYNPCITEDSWITTSNGARQVKSLIGTQFTAIVNGQPYKSSKKGFFYTGNKPVYKIETNEGFSIESTDNHKFLVENNDKNSTEWKELKDIEIGDSIVIHNHQNNKWDGSGTFGEGWLLGNLFGDGTLGSTQSCLDYWGSSRFEMIDIALGYILSENIPHRSDLSGGEQIANIGKQRLHSVGIKKLADKYGITYDGMNKKFNNSIEESSSYFYKGFIRGWFDADGSAQGNQEKGFSIRLSSVNEHALTVCQRMLLRLGIFSKVYKNRRVAGNYYLPDGNGGSKLYACQATHELVISKDCIEKFAEIIGFHEPAKVKKLDEILLSYKEGAYKTKYKAIVKNIEYVGEKDVYDCTIDDVHAFDANGFYAHNCVEINLYGYDELGNSGWEFCNLTTINMKKCKTVEDFYDACRASAIIGTIQASYTSFPYLGEVTERIVKREALLGCSMTGIMDNPDIALNPEIQQNGAKIIIKENERIAALLGINAAARATCVKPEGSASCLLGSSSGIHPHHAKRYFRRVQANKNEFPVQYFKAHNPKAVEESVWSSNKTDEVITFLCDVPDGSKIKNQVSAIDLLKNVMTTQQNWVEFGTTNRSVQPWLRHNVSNTITILEDEWDGAETFIYENRKWFAGISLLPASGDLDYPQAPFSSVLSEREIVQEYGQGAIFASGLIVDGQHAFNNNLWAACDCAMGIGETLNEPTEPILPIAPTKNGYTDKQYAQKLAEYASSLKMYYDEKESFDILKKKIEWTRRFRQFAERYVENNLRKCSHLLKHVSNWKMWVDLKREYIDVDWSLAYEEEFNIDMNTIAGAACAAGGCELK